MGSETYHSPTEHAPLCTPDVADIESDKGTGLISFIFSVTSNNQTWDADPQLSQQKHANEQRYR